MLPAHYRESGETWKSHKKDEAVVILKGIERKRQVSCQEAWEGSRAIAGTLRLLLSHVKTATG